MFSNPTRSNGHTVPSTIIRNITALSVRYSHTSSLNLGSNINPQSQLAYSETIVDNIITLSTNAVPTTDGVVQGLLYVPDLLSDDTCFDLSNQYVPENATRQANLPPTDYILIALVPWITSSCSKSFMKAASMDPLHAMLVYRPDDEDGQPPDADSESWYIDGGLNWKHTNHFPVYAMSSVSGGRMMDQLSLYSGDLSEVPFAAQINETYSPNPADYVRVWTQLTVVPERSLLAIWALVLIILGVIVTVIGGTSLLMHYVQNRRRASLRRRVMDGEVNLEALGIKRLTVPLAHIQTYPLFTYNYDPPIPSPNPHKSVQSPGKASFDSASPSSSYRRGKHGDRLDYQPTCLICLEDFESKITIIRELSCGHIFHPGCIDEFLGELSSLCPLCKASMYPRGHCPPITNSMVRRELGTRKLRSDHPVRTSFLYWWRRLSNRNGSENRSLRGRHSVSTELGTSIPLQKQPSTVNLTRERMQELITPIDETNSDDGRPQCMPPHHVVLTCAI